VITEGQIYRSCDPRDNPPIRLRVEYYEPGDVRAHVVDAETGKRSRRPLVDRLHETATTKSGAPRWTGYILEAPGART
jgi:hypothetical protein